MKNLKIVFIVALLGFVFGCGQKKVVTQQPNKVLTKELSEIPTFPGCESHTDWIEKEFCLMNSIQKLIALNAQKQQLNLPNARLKIKVRVEVDGSTTIIENSSSNKELETIAQATLTSLPFIEPAFSKTQKKKVTSAFFFDVVFENNELTSLSKK